MESIPQKDLCSELYLFINFSFKVNLAKKENSLEPVFEHCLWLLWTWQLNEE